MGDVEVWLPPNRWEVFVMTRVLAAVLFALVGFVGLAPAAYADVAPSYPEYGIGARLEEAEPFPKLVQIARGGPADKAGLKENDAVIAIDGSYSKGGRVPFYFFARGMRGRQGSVVELVILRGDQQVFTVKIARTASLKSNW
jgi:predicted metalloprotease with PDZ domain